MIADTAGAQACSADCTAPDAATTFAQTTAPGGQALAPAPGRVKAWHVYGTVGNEGTLKLVVIDLDGTSGTPRAISAAAANRTGGSNAVDLPIATGDVIGASMCRCLNGATTLAYAVLTGASHVVWSTTGSSPRALQMHTLAETHHPDPPVPRAPKQERRVAGDEGVWIFVLGDMTVLALLLGLYLNGRAILRCARSGRRSSCLDTRDTPQYGRQKEGRPTRFVLATASDRTVLLKLSAQTRARLRARSGRSIGLAVRCGKRFATQRVVVVHRGTSPARWRLQPCD